jgi:L-cysteine/cystine lyase
MTHGTSRREFFQSAAGSLTAASFLGGLDTDGPNEARLDDAWATSIRSDFPVTRWGAYFQTGGVGPTTNAVLQRIAALHELQNTSPAGPSVSAQLQEAEDSCRPLVARAFGARDEEVGLTHNTTEALNIALWSIDWRKDDELIVSNQEHPAIQVPANNLLHRVGVRFRLVEAEPGKDIVQNVLDAVTPRTRLVAVSHVIRRSGRVIPARALADALHARGVRLLLDGAQAAGNVPVDFAALGCDYYALCGHKWLFGPKGCGAILVRRDVLDSTPVSWTGAHGNERYDETGTLEWLPNARRYEFGTRAQAVFGGFAETLRWFDARGWTKILEHNAAQSARAVARLAQSRVLTPVTPAADTERSALIVARLPEGRVDGRAVYDALAKERLLVSPLENPRDIRVCFAAFNTFEEFERVIGRIERLTA